MGTAGRLIGYAAILVVALIAAFGIGNAVGPIGPTASGQDQRSNSDRTGHDKVHDETAGHDGKAAPPGPPREWLGEVSAPSEVGIAEQIAFTVFDESGQPMTDFEVSHEKELHMIVVRADGSHFEHVHPTRDAYGQWTLPWTWDAAGTYRIYVDIVPAETGQPLTLSSSVQVAGEYEPVPLDETVTSVEVDGFEVSLRGELAAGESTPVAIDVSRDGEPVTTLEPYMGAFGHLTGLRQGDLTYLHVHPHGDEPQPGSKGGPSVEFEITAPTEGRYLLYLDFRVDGEVHTAGLVVAADGSPGTGEHGRDAEGDDHDHRE